MRKLILLTMIMALVVCLSACGNSGRSGENNENIEPPASGVENTEQKNTYTIDGITISANGFTVEPFEDVEGFTKRVCVSFTFTNDTDSAFGYIASCEGSLPDGYALESWSDMMEMDLKQIPSHGTKDVTAYLLADDSLDLSAINVTYSFMNYNQEYWDDFGKIMTGEMEQDEYMSKYGDAKKLSFELVAK